MATKLKRPFFDADSLIEASGGKSIAEIFAEQGETSFRNLESDIIEKVSEEQSAVIALGGGAIMRAKNVAVIRHNGILIYLNVPFHLLFSRITTEEGRPLVAKLEKSQQWKKLKQLFDSRVTTYEQADVIIECGTENTPEEIVSKIIYSLEEVS